MFPNPTPNQMPPDLLPPNTTLKQAILLKIESNKGLKRFHQKQALAPTPSVSSVQADIEQLKILQMIHTYQLKDIPGYVNFVAWMSLNSQLWGDRVLRAAEQLWKILRLINKGQINIPTGLVFDVVKALSSRLSSELRLVLQNFLASNGQLGGLRKIRELKKYSSLDDIVKEYLPVSTSLIERNQLMQQDQCIKKLPNRLEIKHCQKQQYMRQLRYQSLVQQMKNCSFKPEISKYASGIKKLDRRRCRHTDCNLIQQEISCKFKAKKVNPQIYDSSVQDIPGVVKHIHKQQYCEAERQRLQRFVCRPIGNFK